MFLLEHKTSLVVDNAKVHSNLQLASVYNFLSQQGTASLLMLPLMVAGEIIGSLSLATVVPHHFSEDEISLAQVVANQVSSVLAQIRSA